MNSINRLTKVLVRFALGAALASCGNLTEQNPNPELGALVGDMQLVEADAQPRDLQPVTVQRVSAPTVGTGSIGPATMVRLGITSLDVSPFALATGPDGHAWYCDGRLLRAGDDDTVSVVDVGAGFVASMAFDQKGVLWMLLSDPSPAIMQYDPVSGKKQTFNLPSPLARPTAIAVADSGDIWLSGGDRPIVGRVDAQQKVFVIAKESSAPPITISTAGLAISESGTVYVSDYAAGRIGKVRPGGFNWITLGGDTFAPSGLAPGLDDSMWFVSLGKTKEAGQIDRNGALHRHTLAADVQGGSDKSASTMVRAPDGSIWFSIPEGSRLGRFSPDGQLDYLPLEPQSLPRQMAFDTAGHLWIESLGILRIDFGQ